MSTISGTVTDSNDEGISGVSVIAIDEPNENIVDTDITDSAGEFSLDVGDASYHILFSYEDGEGNQYNSESKPFVTTA